MAQSGVYRTNARADHGHGHSQYGSYDYYDYGGHGGYGKKEDECCPLVIDAICLFTILGAIAAAALFLERVINIEIMMGKKRRRRKRDSSPLTPGAMAQTIVNGRELESL